MRRKTPPVMDPLLFAKTFWPHVKFYKQQRELIYSVANCRETVCVAGNMLGKDFVSAFIVLWFFMSRSPCRILTTSVDGNQLESVLWGEIKNFIDTSSLEGNPDARGVLNHDQGGPILVNHLHLRKVIDKRVCHLSYVKGKVAAQHESLLGHHITDVGDGVPRTLFIVDEASGVDDSTWTTPDTWAKRKLAIGNPYPTTNFFYQAWKEGSKYRNTSKGKTLVRNVMSIRAEDSPNVRLAQAQINAGKEPDEEMVVPGVLPYPEYVHRRETWDQIRQTIGLDAQFYEGAEVLVFPPHWLDHAVRVHWANMGKARKACAIGVDVGQGEDKTALCAIDEKGVIDLVSKATPDTNEIVGMVIGFMKQHGVAPDKVCIDAGGGGKQIADSIRAKGHDVRTVAFGESVAADNKLRSEVQKTDLKEEKYVFKNRRAQMYGDLRELLDPNNAADFGIPGNYTVLRSELAPIPLLYDGEGRMMLPPKRKKNPNSKEKCLVEIIGHSPDEADALVLAVHAMIHQKRPVVIGGYR